jgi:hypothetical protein
MEKAWTMTVAGGDGTEERAAELFIRDVVTASEYNPGVVFHVPELFLKGVLEKVRERAENGDSLAQRFFEALEKVTLRPRNEGKLGEKYQVRLGAEATMARIMEDMIILAKEVSPEPALYLPEEILEEVKREALAGARKGDPLALEFLERIGDIAFRVLR